MAMMACRKPPQQYVLLNSKRKRVDLLLQQSVYFFHNSSTTWDGEAWELAEVTFLILSLWLQIKIYKLYRVISGEVESSNVAGDHRVAEDVRDVLESHWAHRTPLQTQLLNHTVMETRENTSYRSSGSPPPDTQESTLS